MNRILGISGSLRQGSFNSALLRAACHLRPDLVEAGEIHGVPLYNGDLEEQGIPEAVAGLKARLAESDGLLLVTPEYNNSMPGVLKNALDWLSRPLPEPRGVFRNLPVAVIGASPGGFGTVLAQNAWLPSLRSLGARHWSGGRLMVSGAHRVFDDRGALIDEAVQEKLAQFLDGFERFVAGG